MFLNLLEASMDDRKANVAHPAFVEIIKQLNSEEAGLVRDTLQPQGPMPIVEIYIKQNINHSPSRFRATATWGIVNKSYIHSRMLQTTLILRGIPLT